MNYELRPTWGQLHAENKRLEKQLSKLLGKIIVSFDGSYSPETGIRRDELEGVPLATIIVVERKQP